MSRPIHIDAVWFDQPTFRHIDQGLASIRIVTTEGSWSRTVALEAEELDAAKRLAERHGAHFVLAHSLREWAGEVV